MEALFNFLRESESETSLANANCNSHDIVFQIFRKFSEQRSHVSKNFFKNELLNSAFSHISSTNTVNELCCCHMSSTLGYTIAVLFNLLL